MPGSILFDGVDPSGTGYEFYYRDLPEFHDGPEVQYQQVGSLGRAGAALGPPATIGPKLLTLTGGANPAANTVAALASNLRLLKDLLYAGAKTITFTDNAGNVRVVRDALATKVAMAPAPDRYPFLYLTAAAVKATFLCPSPVYEAAEPRILSLPSAATRYDVVLETAAVFPIIRLMGSATNPTLTYRAADGTVIWQLAFTVTLAATNDWLELDFRRGRCWKYASGVKTAAESLVTTGAADLIRPFDPQDGDVATSQWPTLEVSAGTAMAMWWNANL